MADTIVNFFRDFINNDYLTVFIVAMLPIIEVRGAIPIALAMAMPPFNALLIAFLGSSIVMPLLLVLLKPVIEKLKKIKFLKKAAITLEDIFEAKAEKVRAKIKDSANSSLRLKLSAVFIFVALPLPMTGVWTASAVAAFLNIKFLSAFYVILLGNLCAATLKTIVSLFFIDYLNIVLLVFFLIVAIVIMYNVILFYYKSKKHSCK